MKVFEIITEKANIPKTGVMNRFERYFKARELVKQRRASQIAKRLSDWGFKIKFWRGLLWILGITVAVEELVRNLYAADEMFAEGTIQDENELTEYKEFMWGQFVLTVLTPAIVTKLKITKIVMWVARVIISAMTAAGTVVASPTGVGAAAGAAALVAEQAFFTSLQLFLQSETATKFLAERLFKPLVWLGTVPHEVWDALKTQVTGTTSYQSAVQKRDAANAQKPAGAQVGTTTPAAPAKPAATDNRSYTDRELY
jgi:hypothetical protein